MKKWHVMVFFLVILAVGCIVYVREPYDAPYEGETYQDPDIRDTGDISLFYDSLSPYGYWINYPSRGYVWIPKDTGYGWRPYSRGNWVWSNLGWTWISDFHWGWAPFHYGRWDWDRSYGWFWVPDTLWGPSWVTWRWSDTYFGWAPLPPDAVFVPGVGIRSYHRELPPSYWNFVDGRYFMRNRIDRYILPWERNQAIIRRSVQKTELVMRDRYVMNQGLEFDRVGRLSRDRIERYQLNDGKQAGKARIDRDRVEVYRPEVERRESIQPRSVVKREELGEVVARDRLKKDSEDVSRELLLKQRNEEKLLEESQQTDQQVLERKARIEAQKTETEDAKKAAEARKNYEQQSAEMEKRHQTEKRQNEQRHQTEKKKVEKNQVQKSKVKKKKNPF